MNETQNRTKTYAVIAAIGIGVLAIGLVAGLGLDVPAANGNTGHSQNTNSAIGNPLSQGVNIGEREITATSGGTSVFAQGSDNNDNNLFQLFVTGTAISKVSPDKVSITLGVQTQEPTAQEAAAKNAQAMNAIINNLRELGLETEQFSTSFYNIYPVYEYKREPVQIEPPFPGNQVLVGYRVTNTLTITVSADANVGQIIDVSVEAGGNQVQGVSYFVSEELQAQLNNDLIGEAVLNAKMKAEKALAPLNMQIIGVKTVNLNDVYYPVYRYDRVAFAEDGAAPPTPILPSEQQVSASISVTFLIGPN